MLANIVLDSPECATCLWARLILATIVVILRVLHSIGGGAGKEDENEQGAGENASAFVVMVWFIVIVASRPSQLMSAVHIMRFLLVGCNNRVIPSVRVRF